MLELNRVAPLAVLLACCAPLTASAADPTEICVSSGHHTHHTLGGAYAGFGKLLEEAGYAAESVSDQRYPEALGSCDVFVIVNPLLARLHEGTRKEPTNWSAPYEPAFTREELVGLMGWIRDGGSLLLVIDHAPVPAVSRDLLELLGVVPLNGFTWDAEPGADLFPSNNQVFSRARGTLAEHPITRGRDPEEAVESIIIFGGTAFYPSAAIEPLMVYPRGSIGMVAASHTLLDAPSSAWPRFDIGGWLAGGARRLGRGRVVILGEAAMCTSMMLRHAGLNDDQLPPDAPGNRWQKRRPQQPRYDNRQFCLNVVRWLAGEIDPPPETSTESEVEPSEPPSDPSADPNGAGSHDPISDP